MKTLKNLAIVALIMTGQSLIAGPNPHVPSHAEVKAIEDRLAKKGSKEAATESCIVALGKDRETLRSWKDSTGRLYEYVTATLNKAQNELTAARKAFMTKLSTQVKSMQAVVEAESSAR